MAGKKKNIVLSSNVMYSSISYLFNVYYSDVFEMTMNCLSGEEEELSLSGEEEDFQ